MERGTRMNYWLLKSEPGEFSWEDLKNSEGQTTRWEGVRNYQARNFIKEMKKGDLAFFYHSVVKPQVITGIAEITREAYPDPSQFDESGEYFDERSRQENPRWFVVDVRYRSDFIPPVSRDELKKLPELQEMALFKNSRLSVQPVSAEAWQRILQFQQQKAAPQA